MTEKINSLVWNEKYRPKKIDDFLLPDNLKELFRSYVENETVDNLILYGSTGVGKTSLVRYLTNNITCEVLPINASEERGIDVIREKVISFAMKKSMFGLKIVDFREGEKLTIDAQDALKDVIEESYEYTKFIFTTNNIDKIVPAVRGRCTEIEVYPSDVNSVGKRLKEIMINENLKITGVEKNKLWKYVKRTYPNIRAIINTLQTSSRTGVVKLIEAESYTDDFKRVLDIINESEEIFDSYKKYRAIINSVPHNLISEIYSFYYNNIDNIEIEDNKKLDILDIISKYNYQDGLVVDKEINASSMILEILRVKHNSK